MNPASTDRGAQMTTDKTPARGGSRESRRTTIRKVTLLPPARPAQPAPPEKRPPVDSEPERLCESGDDCPAVAEIGRPEKLARGSKDSLCYRCRSRRAEQTTRDLDARRRGKLRRRRAPTQAGTGGEGSSP